MAKPDDETEPKVKSALQPHPMLPTEAFAESADPVEAMREAIEELREDREADEQ